MGTRPDWREKGNWKIENGVREEPKTQVPKTGTWGTQRFSA
jgi:hypothetical protein